MKKLTKNLKISDQAHKRLKRYARKDETFDDVINRLLDEVETNVERKRK